MSSAGYNPETDPVMMDLFRQEAEAHTQALTSGLLEFEKSSNNMEISEQLMRSAHSIKGAARMVGINVIVDIAHRMEECFVAAQRGDITFSANSIDVLLNSVDTITALSNNENTEVNEHDIKHLLGRLEGVLLGEDLSATPEETNTDSSLSSEQFLDNVKNKLYKVNNILSAYQTGSQQDDDVQSLIVLLQEIENDAQRANLVNIHHLCNTMLKQIHEQQNTVDGIDLSISSDIATCVNAIELTMTSSVEDKDTSHLVDIANFLNSNSDKITDDIEPEPPVPSISNDNEDDIKDHAIKISSARLNKLVGLAGESVVESRWVRSHADSMILYKRRQSDIIKALDNLRNYLDESHASEHITTLFNDIQKRANEARCYLGERLSELDEFDRRVTSLSERLNNEVLHTRMRPFIDCTHGFERMVRDISRSLDKSVELKIIGETTQVDREILSRIEAPLNHLIRNAIDHGIETKQQRLANGKPELATIKLDASHNMGMLSITISDDGHGVDMDMLRQRIVERKLSSQNIVKDLSDAELLDFLYLPGFSTRSDVTEISGRGVGLDVVHSTIQEMRGQIRTTTEAGKGMRVQLFLPLTLSVIRCLLVSISGQAYAFPLARIESIHTLGQDSIKTLEGKQYITVNEKHVGLVHCAQVLEVTESHNNDNDNEVSVILLGDRHQCYGVVVDKFIGERDIAVHLLDPRLGKIRDISAATLLDNGEPALIVDIEDMIRSIEIIISGERLSKIGANTENSGLKSQKSILVVDDSITVREVEKKLLTSHGYYVDVAVDGMDGWNTVQNRNYDLIISDIDMPRMNGIEFVTMLKADQAYRKIPVMIVSYKDRKEDREAGLKAGADYYLTKGSFHDDSLIDAVVDLIGEVE